uniref:Uncharacterized protein n=1 Tax=Rhizophora mucronata TaxID=61149 RepID=A0A2P2P0F8_RHIMU
MADMYLTEKLVRQHLENSSDLSLNEIDDINDDDLQPDLDDSITTEVSLGVHGADSYEINTSNADTLYDHPFYVPSALIGDSRVAHSSTT